MFAQVKVLCGVPPVTGPEPLTPEMVQDALADAHTILDGLGDGANVEGDEPAGTWSAPSWREAATDYHSKRGDRLAIVDIEPDERRRLRGLLDLPLEHAWREVNTLRVCAAG